MIRRLWKSFCQICAVVSALRWNAFHSPRLFSQINKTEHTNMTLGFNDTQLKQIHLISLHQHWDINNANKHSNTVLIQISFQYSTYSCNVLNSLVSFLVHLNYKVLIFTSKQLRKKNKQKIKWIRIKAVKNIKAFWKCYKKKNVATTAWFYITVP